MQNISKQRIHKFKQIKKNCKRLEQKSVQKLFLFNKEKKQTKNKFQNQNPKSQNKRKEKTNNKNT